MLIGQFNISDVGGFSSAQKTVKFCCGANLISTVQIPERLADRLIQVVTERCSAFDLCCSSHLTEGWLQEILINMKIRVIKLHIDLYQRFPMDLLCSDSLGNAFPPPYKSVVALERVQFLTFHSLN